MTIPHMMGEIYHIAHKRTENIFNGSIQIEEKVDGSFISFMLDENDELFIRSKGQQLHEDSPSASMFKEAIESVKERKDLLVPGQIWRGEYLRTAKHNVLRYDRVPKGHIVIFDIELSLGEHATPEKRHDLADFLGYEAVPILYQGAGEIWRHDLTGLKTFFETESLFGGSKIEGIVLKNYGVWENKNFLQAKLVSEAFKEVHQKEWKKSNPTKGDIVQQLIETYKTEARWRKAIQHLRDSGTLTNSPKDIGPLLKEISQDVLKEEEDAIKEALFKLAWPQISRGLGKDFPDFYKNYLLEDE